MNFTNRLLAIIAFTKQKGLTTTMGFKLFLLFEKFLMIFPKSLIKKFFLSLGILAYNISSKYRNIAFANLDFAFDSKLSKEEKESITKYSFKNLMLNFYHLMIIKSISKDELKSKVTIHNEEAVKKIINENRAIIYVTPHYCAWELGAISVGAFIEPVTAVFKSMKNKAYQSWVLDARSTFGNDSLEKSRVVKPLIKLMKQKKACGIVIDTGIKKREGLVVKFLGKDINQTSTPAYLARKYDAAIIPVTIKTNDEENYDLIFYDEIKVQKTENEEADIFNATQLQADWLSKLVRDEPKFWFWVHRRWKYEYPEIYK